MYRVIRIVAVLLTTISVLSYCSGQSVTLGGARTLADTIALLPPDSITPTSVRLRARLVTDGSILWTQFLVWLHDAAFGGRSAGPAQTFEGRPLDTVISYTFTGLTPQTAYDARLVSSLNGSPFVQQRLFVTSDGPRGEGLIVPLFIQDVHNLPRTIHFGVHMYATPTLDGSLGEAEEPPYPPEVLVVLPRFQRSGLGLGSQLDLRPYVSPSQVDTYRVTTVVSPESYPITISWQRLDSLYSGAVTLRSGIDLVNMKADTFYTMTDPEFSAFSIIAAGPRPERNQIRVITRNILQWGYDWGRLGAFIYPINDTTDFRFEWGTTMAYGNQTPARRITTRSPFAVVVDTIRGIQSGTVYYFRGVTADSTGVNFGALSSFRTVGSPSGIDETERQLRSFALAQNYPNPFNPSTEIRYHLPALYPTGRRRVVDRQAGIRDVRHVSLKVYDVLGREVATLVDEVKQPGEYTVRWDARQKDGGQASNMPSGVYFYKMTAGEFRDVKKMVLIR